MKYLKPEMTVLILEAEHVIRTSVVDATGQVEDKVKLPNSWTGSNE